MLLEKGWKLKFSVLLLFILFGGCEVFDQSQSEALSETNISKTYTEDKETLKLKGIKLGLGEKFLIEGVDFLSTMNYDRAIYSLNKSIFYNPIPSESKYFLAKAYFNSGRIKNAISLLEEIKTGDMYDFVIPKLSSIYSRLSLFSDYKVPLSYYTITNIYGIFNDKKIFSLPTTLRFSSKKGIIMNSFSDGNFFTVDSTYTFNRYSLGRKVIDVSYDEEEGKFWCVDFSGVYCYSEGWFNFNLFDINVSKSFKFQGVNFKKIDVVGEWVFLLDLLSKKVIVISKENGEILFSFPDVPFLDPTDLEKYGDDVLVSDGSEIKVFSRYGDYKYSVPSDKRINGFCVFGSNFVIARDDGIFVISNDGSILSTIGSSKFDDVAVDGENKIYGINSEENKIEVFANEYLHTYNLDVDIKGVFVGQFPLVGVLVGVRNIEQSHIDNLKSYNFEVLESGVKVLMPEVEQTYKFLKKKHLYVVIEKSKVVSNNIDVIEDFLRKVLDKLNASDYIDISIVGEDVIELGKTNVSVLYPADFVKRNFTNFSPNYKLFDGISKGITELLYSIRNNAVLVISSGNLEEDISVRDLFAILDYAYNNFIPIYVISFSTNSDLKMLAEKTGGKYYDTYVLFSPEIFLEDYEKNRIFRYLVVFRSLYDVIYPEGKLVDVEVRVRYNNLFGKDKIKYVFPKVKRAQE